MLQTGAPFLHNISFLIKQIIRKRSILTICRKIPHQMFCSIGYVEFLRRCYAPVRERVSFHVAFPKERLPTQSFMTEKISGFDCAHPEASLQELLHLRTPETVRWRLRNPYPQNHLRNLARKNCQTSHVFLTDVDIVPSLDLAQGVDIFLKVCKFSLFYCSAYCTQSKLSQIFH